MRGDVADAHAAGVHVEHAVIQARQPGLALAHQLRLKGPGAVARRPDPNGPEVGLHRLGRVPVAVIAGTARGRLPGRIAQVLGQLGAQRRLQHPARELAHQPARPGDLLRPEPLQRVLQRVLGQQPREPIPNLLNRTLGHRGTRRSIPLNLDFLLGHGGLSRPRRAESVTPTSHRTSDRTARRRRRQRGPEVVLADAGSSTSARSTGCGARGMRPLVSPDASGRSEPGLTRRKPAYQQMRKELVSDDGYELYRQRAQIIEPVFAHTKIVRRTDRFQRRGLRACPPNGD